MYELQSIHLSDEAGNSNYYDRYDLFKLGYDLDLFDFEVINSSIPTTEPTPDLKLFGDSLYIELGNSSWEEAQANAEKLGGNLVSINSKEEQEFIFNTFASTDDGDIGKWIGFTDKDHEGTWKWTDGSSVTYTNWNRGEPNNSLNS